MRGHGEGTIYQRKDGRWEAAISLEGGHRKRIYGKTRREVQSKLSEALHAQQQGQLLAEPSQRVNDYLNHWLEDQVRMSVRPRTYESYALNVRRVGKYIGYIRLDKLRPGHVQHCYGELLKDGLSPRSVDQAHRVLRAALRQAVKWGLLAQAPTAAATPPRSPRREMQPLTPTQVQKLFTSTEGSDLHALWVLLCTTGLRIGEATGLEWRHVDLTAGVLTVQQTLQWQLGKGLVLVEPKTGRSRRSVYLASRTVEVLRQHRDQQKLAWGAAGRSWNDNVMVFCTRSGRPLAPNNIWRSLHRDLEKAGLPLVRVHDLRHTAATYLLSLGTHPKKVQELLGHSSILLTLDTYSHVLPSMHQEIAAQMDKLFEAKDDADEGKPVDEAQHAKSQADSIDGQPHSETTDKGSHDRYRDELPSVLPSNDQNRR